jgi:hypothetical protein
VETHSIRKDDVKMGNLNLVTGYQVAAHVTAAAFMDMEG